MSKIKCPLVTNGFEIMSRGEFSPCCISSKYFQDETGENYNINNAKIIDVWNSVDRRQFIENFDEEFHTHCTSCKVIEKSGGESKRLQELKKLEPSGDITEMQFLDMKMGTTCNLMCTMCGPWSSSKWAIAYKKLNLPEFKPQQWQDMDEFWDQLPDFAHHIKRLELSGGEPFLVKKQEKLIRFLVDNDLAKNIDVLWITNSTIWPENLIQYFKEFKIARIMLSLDNTHEQFEYIRYPALWNDTYEVFKKFKYLHDNKEIILGISHSITMLNAWYLPEFHEWARNHKVPVYNNIVNYPISARDLPQDMKNKIAEKLSTCTDPAYQVNPIVGENNWFINYMMQDGNFENSKIYHNERILPTRTRDMFEQAFPELKDYY